MFHHRKLKSHIIRIHKSALTFDELLAKDGFWKFMTAIYKNYLLDPQPWLEGSYESGSVLPSVPPSILLGSFLEIDSLVFSETFMMLGSISRCASESPIFLKKPSYNKNGQKWSSNKIFGLFRKIYLLALSVNGVEWKYLLLFKFLRKSG